MNLIKFISLILAIVAIIVAAEIVRNLWSINGLLIMAIILSILGIAEVIRLERKKSKPSN